MSIAGAAFQVELFADAQTADWLEFTAICQQVILNIAEIVEASGTGFTAPTQLAYLSKHKGIDTQTANDGLPSTNEANAGDVFRFPGETRRARIDCIGPAKLLFISTGSWRSSTSITLYAKPAHQRPARRFTMLLRTLLPPHYPGKGGFVLRLRDLYTTPPIAVITTILFCQRIPPERNGHSATHFTCLFLCERSNETRYPGWRAYRHSPGQREQSGEVLWTG